MNNLNTKISNESKLLDARKKSLAQFGKMEHRLEFVDQIDGVDFINDAKATNIQASWSSLETLNQSIVWIAEANELDINYHLFSEIVKEKVKVIIVVGDNSLDKFSVLENKVDCLTDSLSLKDAVLKAVSLAMKGDVVLYSPSCSNAQHFQSFQDKGNEFKSIVKSMKV
jgi:UDP-N-acetylmuramoylalanine--D-glutamate ligase